MNACKGFGLGWNYDRITSTSKGYLTCTKHPKTPSVGCGNCNYSRILVWSDGTDGRGFSTVAGHFYGGQFFHGAYSSCPDRNNLPVCGTWSSKGISLGYKRVYACIQSES